MTILTAIIAMGLCAALFVGFTLVRPRGGGGCTGTGDCGACHGAGACKSDHGAGRIQ